LKWQSFPIAALFFFPASAEQTNDKIMSRQGHTLERPLDVIIRQTRAWPAVN
jgi:hypothetical protein